MHALISVIVVVVSTFSFVTSAPVVSKGILIPQSRSQKSQARPRGPLALARTYAKHGVEISAALARGAASYQ